MENKERNRHSEHAHRRIEKCHTALDLFEQLGLTANQWAAELIDGDNTRPLVLHTRVVSGHGGGPEKTLLNSPRFLNELGYDSICVYFRDPADDDFHSIVARAEESKTPLIAVDDHGATDWRLLQRLSKLLNTVANRELIWHGHDYKSNLAGIWLRRKHAMRVVSTVHGWVLKTWKTPLYYAIDRWCLKRCEQVICVSTDLHADCLELGVPESNLHLIDNAIDLEQYDRKLTTAEAKQKLNWPDERWHLGAVGRLAPEKGFDYLIRAVAALSDAGVDVGLSILGDGPQKQELETLVSDLNLSERVRLVGHVTNPKPYYEAMDTYVLSSLREGLPNVLLEAMAFGVPIVATAVAGIPRLIDGLNNGLLVTPCDPNSIATAVQKLMGDQDQKIRMGKAGRSTIENKFCFQKRMHHVSLVYERLTDRT